jgi:uncharacterized DUF497 family protein
LAGGRGELVDNNKGQSAESAIRILHRLDRKPLCGGEAEVEVALTVYTLLVYTRDVLDGLSGFEWDVHNIGHIARHGVTPVEVEQTTGWPHVIVPAAARRREERWKLFGRTTAARYMVVVFAIRHNRMRVVTAYPMNQAERRVYAPQIDA